MNPEQRLEELNKTMAELQAEIAQAKADIAAAKAVPEPNIQDEAVNLDGGRGLTGNRDAEGNMITRKQMAVPEGFHEMEDGTIMADADMESANLQERNTADAVAAYEADKRNLTGNRNSDGDFVQAPDEGLEVPVEISAEDLDAQSFDKDKNTDAQSAKMKRTSNDPVEMIGDLEMDGGRAAAEEVEPSERTMGFKADEGGNMSVDETDDFWKTEEGYGKAMEMYGSKPAWVKEPTMEWNPTEQIYEKIPEENKDEYVDLSIADNIKQLFG